jgi:hypothetical protein
LLIVLPGGVPVIGLLLIPSTLASLVIPVTVAVVVIRIVVIVIPCEGPEAYGHYYAPPSDHRLKEFMLSVHYDYIIILM